MNRLLLILLTITFCSYSFGQGHKTCNANLITNPNFEQGKLLNDSKKSVEVISGWMPIYKPGISVFEGHTAEFYEYNGGLGGTAPYRLSPPSGNMRQFWVSNKNDSRPNYRGGVMNRLVAPINVNTGIYKFQLEIGGPRDQRQIGTNNHNGYGGSGPVRMGIYGVHNPSNFVPSKPSSNMSISNINLFGTGNAKLLGYIEIPASASVNKKNYSISFNSSEWSKSITHIMLTHNNQVLSARRFVAIDNVCLYRTNEGGCDCKGLRNQLAIIKKKIRECCGRGGIDMGVKSW